MDNQELIRVNKLIRRDRPKINADKICETFEYNGLLEIGFLSKQCRNDAGGKCIMCDYGCANGNRKNNVYLNELVRILDDSNSKHLLICSNGSFMDESQINHELYCAILNTIDKYDIPILEVETHYLTITKKKLDVLKSLKNKKDIFIELGLESVNQILQDYVVMKDIEVEKFKSTIDLIHSYGFKIDINALMGMPFLSTVEQLNDAIKTAEWVFENNCSLVIFPINIKPYTLLKTMYSNGFYKSISHWLMIEFLNRIPESNLDKITIAWFGNREEIYEETDERVVFPICCGKCKKDLMNFYDEFNHNYNSSLRRNLIIKLLANRTCDCYDNLIDELHCKSESSFEEKYENFITFLSNNFKE